MYLFFNTTGINNNIKDGMTPDETWKIDYTAYIAILSGKTCSIDFCYVSMFIAS